MKKLVSIYLLIFLGGLIVGWFFISYLNYLEVAKTKNHSSFWQIVSPL